MTESFDARSTLQVGDREFEIFRLDAVKHGRVDRLPYALKILLENLLRHEDGINVTRDNINALANWDPKAEPSQEIAFTPARVILQDFTGVPAVVDLAAMRDAMVRLGGNAEAINPLSPAELVIDHSVQVDSYGSRDALEKNNEIEFQRNRERYMFLRWGQNAFDNFAVVPPGTGIVHQVNLEYLARVVFDSERAGVHQAYPDTVVGTDSHTTMINGLGVLGWGVGGIEAEAAMLGQAITMLVPQVLGFELKGSLSEGATATDLVLTITEMLRARGVVGKFVEFFGDGLDELPLADRATLGNMSPEFGSTCAIFPIDVETIRYLELSGRDPARIQLVEAYAREQGLWREPGDTPADYTDVISLDLGEVEPSIAGPSRPQDRIPLRESKTAFSQQLAKANAARTEAGKPTRCRRGSDAGRSGCQIEGRCAVDRRHHQLHQYVESRGHGRGRSGGAQCTQTRSSHAALGQDQSGAGVQGGDRVSAAFGSAAGSRSDGFQHRRLRVHDLYRELRPAASRDRRGGQKQRPARLRCAVGQSQFRGSHPSAGQTELSWPHRRWSWPTRWPAPWISICSTSRWAPTTLAAPVYLKDIWPSAHDVHDTVLANIDSGMFRDSYGRVFQGDENWRGLPLPEGEIYAWDTDSTYVQSPPYFTDMTLDTEAAGAISGARVLALLGDSVTTDHISPAGSIAADSPAGRYLISKGVEQKDFNSYGSRRGNHEVMMRGTFANIRLRNQLAPGTEGGWTRHLPDGEQMSIFDAAMKYRDAGTATAGHRRQGVWLRLVPGLGGQGHQSSRCQSRAGREL